MPYDMMNTIGRGSGLPIFGGFLHVFSVTIAAIGVVLLIIWASKHAQARQLWTWGWLLTIVGTLLCLASIAMSPFWLLNARYGGFGMMGYGGMMGWQDWKDDASQGAGKTEEEEAAGKALYEELQAKKKGCSDLSESDFEHLGEYLMGTRLGDNHEQMNEMMKRMMGEEGEEQMHAIMGKSLAGCTDAENSVPFRGMMPGGAIMMGN